MSHDEKGERINVSGIDIEWQTEMGICTFAKHPVAMMWVDTTLAGLMAGVQAMVGTERFALALQSEGRKSVETDWQAIVQYPDFHDGFKAIANIAAVAGWGDWKLATLDRKHKEARFTVNDSWEGCYQKALGVCWGSAMAAGKFAGYCSKLFDTNCWAEQIGYIAKSDEHDEFIVKPSLRSIEKEIDNLLSADAATRADMVVALKILEEEITQRKSKELELSAAYNQLSAAEKDLRSQYGSLIKSEKALRESEERWQFALEGAGDGIWDWDPQTNRAVFSRQWKAMLGYEEGEIGDTLDEWKKLVHPDDKATVLAEIQKHIDGTTPVYVSEHRLLCKDGTYKWILDRGKAISRTFDGRPKRIIGTHADISELKKTYQALAASQAEISSIFRAAPIGIGMVVNRIIQEANETLCTMTGYARKELLGQSARMLYPTQEDYDFVGRVKYQGIAEEGTGTVETSWLTKAGAVLDVLLSSSPLDRSDWSKGVTFTALDITERKRTERERLEIERKLLHSQKLESLGVLAGGIAHDFNNLLMAIIGNLDLALLDLSPLSPSREYLEQAMNASRRARDLTRQMLAYSGRGKFVLESINLSELVQENAHLLKASIAKTATLNLSPDSGLPLIQADPGQIQQVIMNLITNASEAIGDNAGTITIATGDQEFDEAYLRQSRVDKKPLPGRFVYAEVSDTGCGMDEDTLQRLFDPFFTTKFTGRGLGMAAVLGIMQGHRGAIIVESSKGVGSTIRVLFPVADTITAKQNTDLPKHVHASSTGAFSGTILIVDDEDAVRHLCASYVARLGLKPLLAANGEEALELFSMHAGEIVCTVLDLNMPKMDGVSAFRELKRLKPDIQVILCSGYNEQEATQHFFGEGLAAFIQKPYRLQDLKNKIEQVLHPND
jgi:PAS domain S-box-containing protein